MVGFCFAPVKVQFTSMSVQSQVIESSTGETVKKNKNTHPKLNIGSTKERVVVYTSLNMDVAAMKLQTPGRTEDLCSQPSFRGRTRD